MRRRKPIAFTLVEMLVVMGIVAVLVALLLPTLSRARAQAQSMQCRSNLRQIFHAFQMYAHDYKSAYPWTLMWFDYLGNNGYLGAKDADRYPTSLAPAGPRWRVLKCPSENPSRAPTWPAGITMTEYENNRCSYHWNFSISQYHYMPTYPYPKTPCRKGFGGMVQNPGGTAKATFVVDGQVNAYGGDYPHFEWNMNNPVAMATWWDPYYAHMFRHPNLTANMLYLDGHVESVRSALHSSEPIFVWIYYNAP